ncbi:uncharacterized protein B0H18DRAFT_85719 [Fomitopsis serialis]|uniref:uncharacterized protein n=1 Tax=Fomitopsis serialis TaxID=139415 RepID=UPI00200883CF|nr:uncharacterized protein B0H18DRAFT_85719 [Neoantrodia serialis]KAH9931490.1 hypothetical protein B0H18DRAFT_85719 [Neoantrodia serialis]
MSVEARTLYDRVNASSTLATMPGPSRSVLCTPQPCPPSLSAPTRSPAPSGRRAFLCAGRSPSALVVGVCVVTACVPVHPPARLSAYPLTYSSLAYALACPRLLTYPLARPPARSLRARSSAVSACWAFAQCAGDRRASPRRPVPTHSPVLPTRSLTHPRSARRPCSHAGQSACALPPACSSARCPFVGHAPCTSYCTLPRSYPSASVRDTSCPCAADSCRLFPCVGARPVHAYWAPAGELVTRHEHAGAIFAAPVLVARARAGTVSVGTSLLCSRLPGSYAGRDDVRRALTWVANPASRSYSPSWHILPSRTSSNFLRTSESLKLV